MRESEKYREKKRETERETDGQRERQTDRVGRVSVLREDIRKHD